MTAQEALDNIAVYSALHNGILDTSVIILDKLIKACVDVEQDLKVIAAMEEEFDVDTTTLFKAFKIIKELFDFDFAIRFGDNQPMIKITNKRNGQYWELPETTEIWDLLKEVFSNDKR